MEHDDEFELEREMSLLHGGSGEVKTVREWLADEGYVAPDEPASG